MSDSAINFGIVGCGRIAQRHAQHINNNGRLVATYDIKPENLKLASEYGAKAFPSYESLEENKGKMHVVSVCSPMGCMLIP